MDALSQKVFLFYWWRLKEGETMKVIKEGDKVSILFEAKLENGETVLKTENEKPLEMIVGAGAIPVSVEKALINMKAGDTKTITLESSEAFGPRIEDLIIELPKEGFGSATDLEVGSRVSMNSPEGKRFVGTVTEIKDEKITVDFNHPLAGETLVFIVTVVSINDSSAEQ